MHRTLRALISLAALICALAMAASAESHARIVRLSTVDGTVQIDSSALSQALSSNFAAVRSAFQGSGGVGQSISSDLLNLTDPVTGLMNADLKSVADQQSTIADRIQTLNDYLTTQRKMLTDKYTQINVLMQEQTAQIAQVQAELGVKNQQ